MFFAVLEIVVRPLHDKAFLLLSMIERQVRIAKSQLITLCVSIALSLGMSPIGVNVSIPTTVAVLWMCQVAYLSTRLALRAANGRIDFIYDPKVSLRTWITRLGYRVLSQDDNAVACCFKQWVAKMPDTHGDNPHHQSATVRKNATSLIMKIVNAQQRRPYLFQKGKDPKARGTGLIYDPIDCQPTLGEFDSVFDTLVMIDVDFHCDMRTILQVPKHVLMYTALPMNVPEEGAGHSTYIKDNELFWESNGGFCTHHKIWNYGADLLTVYSWFGLIATCYKVRTYSMPMGRAVIALTPLYQFSAPFGIGLWGKERHQLRTYVFTHPSTRPSFDWVAFKSFIPPGEDGVTCVVTVCANGPGTVSVVLPEKTFGKLADTARTWKSDLVPEHTVIKFAGESNSIMAAFIADYVSLGLELDTIHRGVGYSNFIAPKHASTCQCVLCLPLKSNTVDPHYKIGTHISDNKEKPTMTATRPVVEPTCPKIAMVPVRDNAAAKEALTKRLQIVRRVAESVVDPTVVSKIPDFVSSLMRRLTLGAPVQDWIDHVRPCYKDTMLAAANQPLEAVSADTDLRDIQGFLKAESYDEAKAPRLISPIHPKIQARLYKYVQALQAALHDQKWFAFGNPPHILARAVEDLSSKAMCEGLDIAECDYSKFDGTINRISRELERAVYGAAFPDEGELKEILEFTHHLRLKICGAVADTHNSRSSGVADTCLMNTINNLFVWYELDGDAAFSNVIVGGDDSIYATKHSAIELQQAAAKCGFSAKVTLRPLGEPFSFLGRYYGWGSRNSICDPVRTLIKAHLIGDVNMTDKQVVSRLREKFTSLLLTDANTPVVGDVLRRCLRMLPDYRIRKVVNKFDWYEAWKTVPYPNEYENWMTEFVSARVRLISGPSEWPQVEQL